MEPSSYGLTQEQLIAAGISPSDAAELMTKFAKAWPALADTVGFAVKAFTQLGDALQPALDQACINLADAGYHCVDGVQGFYRSPEDNVIPFDRVLRYASRSPQNRRRKRERRQANRRARRNEAAAE